MLSSHILTNSALFIQAPLFLHSFFLPTFPFSSPLLCSPHFFLKMRIIGPAPADKLSDWDGSPLSPKLIAALTLGCVVRIFVENSQTRCGEAIYCEISKIKDGTFWGVVRDTYRLSNWIGEMEKYFHFPYYCAYLHPSLTLHSQC